MSIGNLAELTGQRPVDLLDYEGTENERLLLDLLIMGKAQEAKDTSTTKGQIGRRTSKMAPPRIPPRFKQ